MLKSSIEFKINKMRVVKFSSFFSKEFALRELGFRTIAGVDEAGRGPLAGPVVASAVAIRELDFANKKVRLIFNSQHWRDFRDSKRLSPKKREKFFKIITQHPLIEWGIGIVSERIIDKVNILNATKISMKRAIKDLNSKLKAQKRKVDFVIVDGNFKINNIKIPQEAIVKADERVFSCICAGIIAKVVRDRIMKEYHLKYPQYHFDVHKGYPTKIHLSNLKKWGPCKIHRKTFFPVNLLLS